MGGLDISTEDEAALDTKLRAPGGQLPHAQPASEFLRLLLPSRLGDHAQCKSFGDQAPATPSLKMSAIARLMTFWEQRLQLVRQLLDTCPLVLDDAHAQLALQGLATIRSE